MEKVRALIQARMSSQRFPGKVLAPLAGRAIIWHVVERISRAVGRDAVIVVTSDESSDDPLAAYLASLGVRVFRGSLTDVLSRFQACLRANPCEWFFRICADSPLHEPALLQRFVTLIDDKLDLITNAQRRTFPKGMGVELIRTRRFMELNCQDMTPPQREHVTKYYYDNQADFAIRNVESGDASQADLNYSVDTIDDLARIERMLAERNK